MQLLAAGEHELTAGSSWLTAGERARLDTLRFTKRRVEYLLRRWTAKRAVAIARSIGDPSDPDTLQHIEIGNHPTGAPFVLVDGAPLDADISVTDRAGWAVCLVGAPGERMTAVGVDLEIVEPRSDGFVSDFLTDVEQQDVRSRRPRSEQDAAANLYWSAKEAALKVLRTGLRADTRTVEVRFDPADPDDQSRPGSSAAGDGPGWGRMRVLHTPSERVFPGWWRRDGAFVLTMATEAPLASPPSVLRGSADLTGAVPVHSWLTDPTAW